MRRLIVTTLSISILVISTSPPASGQDLIEELKLAIAEERHADARAILDKLTAEEMGYTPAQFEMTRARFRNLSGDYEAAKQSAGQVLALASPDDPAYVEANAHVELGVAHFNQQEYDRAIEELRAGIELGTTEPGMAREHLAAALGHKGELAEAQEEIEKALDELEPGSLAYQSAEEWRRSITEARRKGGAEKPWSIRPRVGFGYTTNALQYSLGDLPLPGGVSDTATFFWDAGLDAHVDLLREPDDSVRLYDSLSYRRYEEARSLSRLTNTLGIAYGHRFDRDLSAGAYFQWQLSWLLNPGRKFVRVFQPGLFTEYKWDEDNTTQARLSHGWTNYYLPGNRGARNPDATFWDLSINHELYLDSEHAWALLPSLSVLRNSAQGSDWDYTRVDPGLALRWYAAEGLSLSAGVRAGWSDFDHVHSAASTPKRREDFTITGFAGIEWQPCDYVTLGAGVAYTRNDSNIGPFRYDELSPTATVAVDAGGALWDLFGGSD